MNMSNSLSNDDTQSKNQSYFSFLKEVVKLKGVPQLLLIFAMTSVGSGMISNIAPGIMTDSFSRYFYDYTGPACSTIGNNGVLPNECEQATAYAQTIASIAALVKATIAFFASPLLGSLSDRRGRKYLLLLGVFLSVLPQIVLLFILFIPSLNPISYYVATTATGISV